MIYQSGFKPVDLCINQFLSITHQVYKSFDDCQEVQSVFSDILKAFDKEWHKGFIFKLKQNGISGNTLSTLIDFLKIGKHWVVWNGRFSSWSNMDAEVPGGSVLRPLLFLQPCPQVGVVLWISLWQLVGMSLKTSSFKWLLVSFWNFAWKGLKVGLLSSIKVCFICFNKRHSEMMKKYAFYFILKAPFLLKIFKFSLDFFGHVGKQLDKK